MIEAAKEAEEKLVEPLFEFRNFGSQLPDNWYTVANGAEFGTDYLTRTAVAKSNILVKQFEDPSNKREDELSRHCSASITSRVSDGTLAARVSSRPEEAPQDDQQIARTNRGDSGAIPLGRTSIDSSRHRTEIWPTQVSRQRSEFATLKACKGWLENADDASAS